MLNFLPMERLLFAEETGLGDGAGGGGAAIADDEGGDYDYGDEGEVDLFANESDDEVVDDELPGDESDDSTASSDAVEESSEAAEVDAAEVDESAESVAVADDFEESLLNRASAVGFNFNDVKQFGSNARLKIAVERSEALARNILEQQQRHSSSAGQRSDQQQNQPSKFEQFHAAQKEKIDVLAAEGYGDEAVAVMHQQNDMALEQARIIDSLQQQSRNTQNEASVAAQQAAEVQFERSMDGYLESLGDEYSSLFGKGASASMSQGTQQFANRARVFQVASGFRELAQQKGWEVPSESRAFEMAVNAEFGNRAKELARNEIKSKLRKSSQSATSRPSQSSGRALTGEERAAERVNSFFKANTSHDDASGDFDEEI